MVGGLFTLGAVWGRFALSIPGRLTRCVSNFLVWSVRVSYEGVGVDASIKE